MTYSRSLPASKAHTAPSPASLSQSAPLRGAGARALRPLRFITCGSVDDGKSTLIGRLLWDSKAVARDHAERLEATRKRAQNGHGLPDFASLLDGLQAEREQGITIDVAYRYFSTANRAFIIADTPGHEQYTRNMVTGASTADLAVLLVDVRAGLLTQTLRHAAIVALMGVKQAILVVNKMDLADYDAAAFRRIENAFRACAGTLGIEAVSAIPISALKGENVVHDAGGSMPWYRGGTLLETLERADPKPSQRVGFRLPVQRVCRPDESFRGLQGTVVGGSVKPGDPVMVLPSGVKANVTRIITFDLERNAAVSGDAITLLLDRPADAARGDMIVGADSPPLMGYHFEAHAIALMEAGIESGKRYWLKAASRRQHAIVTPEARFDPNSGAWERATSLTLNEIGRIRLRFEEKAMFDLYAQDRDTGSFILIDADTHETVAGGMIQGATGDVTPFGSGERDGVDEGEMVLMALPPDLAEKLLGLRDEIDRTRPVEIVRLPRRQAIRRLRG